MVLSGLRSIYTERVAILCARRLQVKAEESVFKIKMADTANGESQVVTPWEVKGEKTQGGGVKINYEKLINDFGVSKIDNGLIKKVETLTGIPCHPLLKRGLFFAHRDLDKLLEMYEKNKKIYIYTGRGPSSESMHVGHAIPFLFCKYLQEAFNAGLIVQFTDDEKYLFGKNASIENTQKWMEMNAKDIISLGFNPEKTYFFSNLNSMRPSFYKNVVLVSKMVTISQSKSTFGLSDCDSIGKVHFVALESAPAFSSTFPEIFPDGKDVPCLIPCAIDQDPFFRICRDVASRSNRLKPCTIYSSFMPALYGVSHKMSSSDDTSAIFLNDSPQTVKKKINKYAFSGGKDTLEEHRKLGGDPEVDICFQYLRYLMEDDEELESYRTKYLSGELLSSQMKTRCIEEINKLLSKIQENRKLVTEHTLKLFMTPKKL